MDKSNHIGKKAANITFSKFVVMFISLISGMLLSRFRSLTEYGTYSQIQTIMNLATTIIMMGLPNSLNYFLAKAETEEERIIFLSNYYSLSTILSLIIGAVLVTITPLLITIFDNSLINSFIYFLAFFPWTKIICASIENVLIIYNKTKLIIFFRISNSLCLLGIILLVQVMSWTFNIYMFLYLVIEVIFTLLTYLIVKNLVSRIKFLIKPMLIKQIFAFSIPIGLASMIGTINIELDKIVIGSMLGTKELAVYTNASKELPVTIIASSITAVLLPQMVKFLHVNKVEKAVELWKSAVTISFSIICFLSFACFVFAPEVITILYSKKYLSGVDVFRIYCIVLLLKCTYFGMLLNAVGKTRFILYSSICSLILNLIFNYIFFYLFGFIGPALATFASTLIMQLFQLFYSAKVCKISFRKIFPWKNCFLLILLNIFIGIFFYILNNYLINYINSILSSIILGIMWTIILLIILYKPLMKEWNNLNK